MNPLNSVAGAITTGFVAAILVIIIVVTLGASPGSFYELGLARWLHIISGITWIGLLYYFNLVQTPGLAAAAGALLGPIFVVTPTMGDLAAAKAFAIVILGGMGSLVGATLGGFILAFAEEISVGYISSGYRDAMGFLLIIIILLFRPTGLFAQKERIS